MGRYSNYQYALILSLAGYGLPMLLVSLYLFYNKRNRSVLTIGGIFIYIHFINLFFMFVLLYIYILSIYFYVCTFVFMSLWHHNLINLKSKVFIPNRFLWTFLYLKIKIRLPFSPIEIQEKDDFFDFFTWKFLHLF